MTQIVETELRCTRFALKREVSNVVGNYLYCICAVVCCAIILPRNQKAKIKSLAGRCRNMALNSLHISSLAFKDYAVNTFWNIPITFRISNSGCSSTIFTPFTVNSNWHPSGTTI